MAELSLLDRERVRCAAQSLCWALKWVRLGHLFYAGQRYASASTFVEGIHDAETQARAEVLLAAVYKVCVGAQSPVEVSP